ncbi:hypothetical protein GcM1_173012 [Golovinomyces cichoracearum]|uniref:Uncharacterized protein n=1 Tax=Golovinomyces cichoracearum TaxID=62708 RepID=A0A420J605_9PEZI|nr:hypothetical protein GcM1_173012 [Golovinomyces cichoracearum]
MISQKGDFKNSQNSNEDEDRDLPKARGNRAIRAALVNPDLHEGNIIISGRTRAQVKKQAMPKHTILHSVLLL